MHTETMFLAKEKYPIKFEVLRLCQLLYFLAFPYLTIERKFLIFVLYKPFCSFTYINKGEDFFRFFGYLENYHYFCTLK